MFRLPNLPVDILVTILSYKDFSHHVITLWKCGDRLLNDKMAKYVTSVDLVDDSWNSTSRWPKCLSQLYNLRSLSISRLDGLLMGAPALSQELRLLSPKLKCLKLVSNDAVDSFKNYAQDGVSLIETQYPRGASTLFDLSKYFPELETLSVECQREGFGTCSFSSEDYNALPDTITMLNNSGDTTPTFTSPLSRLPPNLKVFNFWIPEFSEYSELPRNLIEIGRGQIDSAEEMLGLPRSLVLSRLSTHWDYDISKAVPPNLVRFTIAAIDLSSFYAHRMHWAEALPKSMTELEMDEGLLDSTAISLLPRSLTSLTATISWEILEHEPQLPQWPPNLAHGSLYPCITHAQSHLWPPKWAELEFESWSTKPVEYDEDGYIVNGDNEQDDDVEQAESDVQLKPLASTFPHATSIRIAHYWRDNSKSFPISDFPANLTQITVHSRRSKVAAPISLLSAFPASVRDLNIDINMDDFNESEYNSFMLPPHLTKLQIDHWRIAWFPKLPPTLTEAYLGELADFDKNTPTDIDITQTLPSRLRILDFHCDNFERGEIYEGKFGYTLTHLVSLYIAGTIAYSSSLLRSLPRSLTSLMLPLKRIDEVDAPFIPPNLHCFRILDEQFDGRHDYLVDLAPEGIEDQLIWPREPHYIERRKARVAAARERSALYPDPRTVKSLQDR